jgi:hypothetical protein
LNEWVTTCESKLQALARTKLKGEVPSRYDAGTWTFSYAFEEPIDVSVTTLMDALRAANKPVTGWPVFIIMGREPLAPYPQEDGVESWLAEPGAVSDAAHSDFWRASNDGRLFLLRGYQEDGMDGYAPGTVLDRGLPIWRVGECLLHGIRCIAPVFLEGEGERTLRA